MGSRIPWVAGSLSAVLFWLASCQSLVPAACAPGTHLATPVAQLDLDQLQALADEITAREMGKPPWDVMLVDADETRGTVVVGVESPTADICLGLHARYGPLIEIIQAGPIRAL